MRIIRLLLPVVFLMSGYILPMDYTQMNEEECVICLEPIDADGKIIILQCAHKFDGACLTQAVQIDYDRCYKTKKKLLGCPLCRGPLCSSEGKLLFNHLVVQYEKEEQMAGCGGWLRSLLQMLSCSAATPGELR